tara:strand:+ start:375 stop:671 length:297 start_codon:yes stop_codon:yes gene_type:complete
MVSRRLSKNYRKNRKNRKLSKNYKKVGKSRKVSKNIRRKQRNRRKSYKGGSNQDKDLKALVDLIAVGIDDDDLPYSYSESEIEEAKKIVAERTAKAEA